MPIINQAGLKLIQSFEGLRLKTYDDGTGVLSIGFGHTGPDVEAGETITQARAVALLYGDLRTAENAVQKLVEIPLSPNQFSALVSFVFNVGTGAFEGSTLRALLNQGNLAGAAEQFVRWDDPGTPEEAGLLRRRIAERLLFETP